MSAHVYRLYDADRNLLYIGCTADVVTRVSQHVRAGTGGGDLIHDWTAEQYDSRDEALEAEGAAIRAERPPYNQRGRNTGVPMGEVGDAGGDFAQRLAWRIAQACIARGVTTLALSRATGIPLTRLSRLLRSPGRLNVAELAAIGAALDTTAVALTDERTAA
jgi:predicted GIY-YIG superfamily endonuclease